MKILVAEDDPDQLSLRCMLLAHSGFETLAAPDPGTAMTLALDHNPECAVIDLNMPTDERGLELVRELKKLHPGMHVIMLTGRDARQVTQAPENALVDDVFIKGSPSGALIQKLRTVAAAVASR
jgi:two-component system, response regulator RegA